jgi:hypothetical protein
LDWSTPISEGTPSLTEASSLSASASLISGRSLLNVSTYALVAHGTLPYNRVLEEDGGDMYSMEHRVSLGTTGHHWYISIWIDYVDVMDARGLLLSGMSSVLETFPSMIDGFELHPLDPNSTLPVLTSNRAEDGFPQSAAKMFKYLHVKNKINPWGAAQPTADAPTVSLNRFDDNAALRPSPTLWGTARVQAREHIREAVEAWVWDLHNTIIQVRRKAHQSSDSSAYIQIMCCPDVSRLERYCTNVLFGMTNQGQTLDVCH